MSLAAYVAEDGLVSIGECQGQEVGVGGLGSRGTSPRFKAVLC
ncbi:hypothetical protein T11_2260 [Trichinella zimbabwensis]|uniref:Uncharacterized protein n=1 Tax=Trichinella zimbabwensis TaxID=268475 RepID=A0A0V1DPC6_9BILA|nr:hypothetical protein T11_2260 [Trichinella zimbabwensis]